MPNSIAVLRLTALGDVCMTVPLINRLRKQNQYRVSWIIAKPLLGLVKSIPNVNFIAIDKPQSVKDYYRLHQQFKSFSFDTLLAVQANLRINLLSTLIKAREKYGYDALHSRDLQSWFVHKKVPAVKEHLVDSFLRFTDALHIDDDSIDWEFPIETDAQDFAAQQLSTQAGPWLAVSVNASKAERNWPIAHYAHTLNHLAKHWQFSVALLGGPGDYEKQLTVQLQSQLNMPWINLVGKTNLQQLAACLTQADALLAPDTGLVHIANAKNTPVVGLYAVAPSQKTGPYGNQQWSIDVFDKAVKELLHKNPRTVSWRQRVHHPKAMQLITPKRVIDKLSELFSHLDFPRHHSPMGN